MSDIVQVVAKVKDTDFLADLLQEFVVRGLGSLPGRETTITLVALLLKHHPDWQNNPPRDYEIARLLRTSPRKIRNVRDEIGYRDSARDDDWCRKQLIEILKHAERLKEGKLVTFQIDDGLVRDYTQKLVRENYGIFEQGLNASIVKISGPAFAALVLAVMPEDELQALIREFIDDGQDEDQEVGQTKTPIRLFVESFAKKAGEEAGKQSTRLAFLLLTGGLSEIGNALEVVREVFNDQLEHGG